MHGKGRVSGLTRLIPPVSLVLAYYSGGSCVYEEQVGGKFRDSPSSSQCLPQATSSGRRFVRLKRQGPSLKSLLNVE